MSDSAAQFASKNRAQFALLEKQLATIGQQFIGDLAEHLVVDTPGPGLQTPGTEYVATGRLRAGWRWGAAQGEATNWTDGPYTDDGGDVVDAIRSEVKASAVLPVSYLWNDVGYAVLVHDGLGRHKAPRPWRDLVVIEASAIAEGSIITAMAENRA